MSKITAIDKIYYYEQYLAKKTIQGNIARVTNVKVASVQKCFSKYESMMESGFLNTGNKKYSKELKLHAGEDYLASIDSLLGSVKKYGIPSLSQQ